MARGHSGEATSHIIMGENMPYLSICTHCGTGNLKADHEGKWRWLDAGTPCERCGQNLTAPYLPYHYKLKRGKLVTERVDWIDGYRRFARRGRKGRKAHKQFIRNH